MSSSSIFSLGSLPFTITCTTRGLPLPQVVTPGSLFLKNLIFLFLSFSDFFYLLFTYSCRELSNQRISSTLILQLPSTKTLNVFLDLKGPIRFPPVKFTDFDPDILFTSFIMKDKRNVFCSTLLVKNLRGVPYVPEERRRLFCRWTRTDKRRPWVDWKFFIQHTPLT